MARGGGGGRGGGGRGAGRGLDVGGGTMNEILNAYDEELVRQFEEYQYAIRSTWENFQGNEGQMVIVQNSILPHADEHIEQARDMWPWSTDADEYLAGVFSCYDSDVMDRAFSGTIFELYDHIAAIWQMADHLQQEHDNILGHSAVHSTNPPWTA